jgi:hypothetical protein
MTLQEIKKRVKETMDEQDILSEAIELLSKKQGYDNLKADLDSCANEVKKIKKEKGFIVTCLDLANVDPEIALDELMEDLEWEEQRVRCLGY